MGGCRASNSCPGSKKKTVAGASARRCHSWTSNRRRKLTTRSTSWRTASSPPSTTNRPPSPAPASRRSPLCLSTPPPDSNTGKHKSSSLSLSLALYLSLTPLPLRFSAGLPQSGQSQILSGLQESARDYPQVGAESKRDRLLLSWEWRKLLLPGLQY